MRRSLTYIVVLALLLTGGYLTQRALAEDAQPLFSLKSPLPELPAFDIFGYTVPGGLLLALVVGFIVFNVAGMGITLAIVTRRMSRELASTPAAPRPASGAPPAREPAAAKGAPASNRADRVAMALVIFVLLLAGAWALARPGSPLPPIPESVPLPGGINVMGWAVFGAAVAVLVGGTLVTGFALARLFDVLNRQLAKVATMPPQPVDLAKPLRTLKALTQVRLTFVEKALTCLVVALIAVILGVTGVFVVPAYLRVSQVDEAIQGIAGSPTAAPTAAATAEGADQGQAIQAEVAALPAGDPAAGQALFAAQPCAGCHSLQAGATLTGPSLDGVGSRAGERKPGYTPEMYIYESITRPDAFVVEGFPSGLMPKTFRESLSDQQIADLIAYLSNLK